jgi:hypothetical protein
MHPELAAEFGAEFGGGFQLLGGAVGEDGTRKRIRCTRSKREKRRGPRIFNKVWRASESQFNTKGDHPSVTLPHKHKKLQATAKAHIMLSVVYGHLW